MLNRLKSLRQQGQRLLAEETSVEVDRPSSHWQTLRACLQKMEHEPVPAKYDMDEEPTREERQDALPFLKVYDGDRLPSFLVDALREGTWAEAEYCLSGATGEAYIVYRQRLPEDVAAARALREAEARLLRETADTSPAERQARLANLRYENAQGQQACYAESEPFLVEGYDDVQLVQVGRNASHMFYLGWDSQGNAWRASCGPRAPREGEWEYALDLEIYDDWHVAPVPLDDVGYIGHY